VVVVGTPEDSGAYYYYQYRTHGRRKSTHTQTQTEGADGDEVLYDAETAGADEELFAGSPGEPDSG
jgi:hypothetical protein